MTLSARIKEKAVELGFDLVGIAPAAPAIHAGAFYGWLAKGYHGDMDWLAKDPERRTDPRRVLSGARSVIVAGASYFQVDPPREIWNDPSRGRIARYAWGLDYHDELTPRLRALAEFIRREAETTVHHKVYVDTGPILEREVAARAGLGFIGKNSLLIHPDYGSYLFLGEILVDLELEYDEPAGDGGATFTGVASAPPALSAGGRKSATPGSRLGTCGRCRRCLDICPTHAFPAAYVVDSNRCISYLTIELKGSIPKDLRPLMGNWIYGCDACQSICPWVRRYAKSAAPLPVTGSADQMAPRLVELMALDETAFRSRFRNSPVLRAKRRGLLRNVAVALGNWGEREALPALEKALRDPEPLVREHAAWAIARIR